MEFKMNHMPRTKLFAYWLFAFVVCGGVLLAVFLPQTEVTEAGEGIAAAGTPNPNPPFGTDYAIKMEIPLPTNHSISYSAYDAQHNYIYAYNQDSDLLRINLNNGTVMVLFQLPAIANLHMSQDGQYLLISVHPNQIRLMNTTTNQITSSYAIPSTNDEQLVVGNHIFIRTPNTIERRHALTGSLITSVGSTGTLTMAASADQTTLYVATGWFELRKYDISGGGITLVQTATINTSLQRLAVTGDGTMLIGFTYGLSYLHRYHTADLTHIDSTLINGLGEIGTDADYFYTLRNASGSPQFKAHEITSGDVAHVHSPDNGSGASITRSFNILGDRQIGLFVGTNGTLKFRWLTPTYYGIAMPTMLKDYCFRAYTDSFDDSNSGWPIATSGSILYRYLNGEYSIYHQNADTWGAATRGDIWLPGTGLVAIKGRLVSGEGLWGMVFGLNADWSEFYTFEILPQDQIWALFHFTATSGWQLLAADQSPHIHPTNMNELAIRNENTSYAQFEINDSMVYAMNAIPLGRLGLSAGSFTAHTDARYDDYVFAGKNCPMPTAPTASTTFTSPDYIPPHPLGELGLVAEEE